jgi:hypothetical protein
MILVFAFPWLMIIGDMGVIPRTTKAFVTPFPAVPFEIRLFWGHLFCVEAICSVWFLLEGVKCQYFLTQVVLEERSIYFVVVYWTVKS